MGLRLRKWVRATGRGLRVTRKAQRGHSESSKIMGVVATTYRRNSGGERGLGLHPGNFP